jgi:hypothetical protein
LRVVANLADAPQTVLLDGEVGEVLLAFGRTEPIGAGVRLDAESVAVVTVQG